MKNYHAHIYYELKDEKQALELYERAELLLGSEITFAKWFGKRVGPHPTPMFELQFNINNFYFMKKWLNEHRGTFSVLIHEDTGNDVRDHIEGITWLGTPLKINFEFFDLILTKPELRVHPE